MPGKMQMLSCHGNRIKTANLNSLILGGGGGGETKREGTRTKSVNKQQNSKRLMCCESESEGNPKHLSCSASGERAVARGLVANTPAKHNYVKTENGHAEEWEEGWLSSITFTTTEIFQNEPRIDWQKTGEIYF